MREYRNVELRAGAVEPWKSQEAREFSAQEEPEGWVDEPQSRESAWQETAEKSQETPGSDVQELVLEAQESQEAELDELLWSSGFTPL